MINTKDILETKTDRIYDAWLDDIYLGDDIKEAV